MRSFLAIGRKTGLRIVFKYDLNGLLLEFKRLEGILSDNQVQWFFFKGNFPYKEVQIKEWIGKLKVNFEITIGTPDLSFEALWNLYNYKESRKDAEKSFSKLKEADIIKCFIQVPKYKKKIASTGIAQALLATWINKQRYNDEY